MKLKKGVEIEHKKKRYRGEIPDEVFEEIYGGEKGSDKATELFEKKKKKFEFVKSKPAKASSK